MAHPILNTLKVGTFLGIRSITRGNKAVLGLTVLVLALVYINLLFFPALLSGLIKTINDMQISVGTSNFILLPRDGNSYFTDASALKSRAEKVEGVEAVASRTAIGTEIEFDGRVSTYGTYIVDPEEYVTVFDIEKYMVEGEFLETGDLNQIVLGVQVAGADDTSVELYASSLKSVHVGDKIRLRAGELEQTLNVKGIFKTGTVQNDLRSFVSERAMGLAMPEREDTASSIHIKMDSGYTSDDKYDENETLSALSALSSVEHPLTAVAWQDMAGIMVSVTGTFESIIRIIQSVALVVGGITVFVVTYVDILNKRRQIELQRALGIGTSAIVVGNALRALVLVTVGVIFGALLYVFVITPLEAAYPFSFPFGDALLVTSTGSFLVMGGVLALTALAAAVTPRV